MKLISFVLFFFSRRSVCVEDMTDIYNYKNKKMNETIIDCKFSAFFSFREIFDLPCFFFCQKSTIKHSKA